MTTQVRSKKQIQINQKGSMMKLSGARNSVTPQSTQPYTS